MKLIFFLILTLQLVAIVQSQDPSGSGNGGSAGNSAASGSADTGGGGGVVQPSTSPSTDPTTPSNSALPSSEPSHSVSPSSDHLPATTPATSDQTTPTTPSGNENTPTSAATDNNNNNNSNVNTYSHNNSRSRSNNQSGSPTGSPSSGSGTGSNDSNSSNTGNNNNSNGNNEQQQQQGGDQGSTSSDNVGKIAGGVVGGVVALALVGGLLTWLNRRGGCTSRTKRRNHDTFDDFAIKDPESDKMGYNDTAMSNVTASNGGMNPASPFQRRMAPPLGPQTTGYMNLGNDEFSESSTQVMPLMNQDMAGAGYPPMVHQQHQQADPYYATGYGNSDYKTQLHQPTDPWQQDQQQQPYYPTITSPQSVHDNHHQMKPDTVDHKPHEI